MVNKLKEIIKEKLFGKKAVPVCPKPKPGYKTTQYGCYTNFGEWCKDLNVSLLYNKDKVFIE